MFTAEVPLPSGSLCALCLVRYSYHIRFKCANFFVQFLNNKKGKKRRRLDSGHTVVFS